MDIMKKIEQLGVVPVVVLDDVKDALPLARAMQAGGVPCAEVTLRTAAGLASIEKMREMDDMLVGAGTVITLDQCKDALSAGAKFIVSPGTNVKVVEHCLANNVPVLPGCVTPTEIMAMMELGIDTFKFFPANVYGGLKAMKALSAPFGGIKFIPTGGVNGENLAEYLSAKFIRAVGGSWLCAKDDVNAGNFDKITALCKQASEIAANR